MLGLSFAAVIYDMFTLTPAEQLDRELGGFDASVALAAGGPIKQDADGYGMDGADRAQPARRRPPTRCSRCCPPARASPPIDAREVRLQGGNGEQKLPAASSTSPTRLPRQGLGPASAPPPRRPARSR